MKKLASLVVVLVLALCMATTAFAAEDQIFNVNAEADLPASITLEAGEIATLNINDFTLFNRYLKVTGGDCQLMVNYWTSADSVDGVATIKMEGRRSCTVTIENKGAAAATYALSIFDPVGSVTNPEAVTETVSANITIASNYAPYYYYFDVVECGTFYINNVVASEGAENYNVTISTDGFYEHTADILGANWQPTSGTSLSVKPGDKLVIMVTAMDYDGALETVNVSFSTSFVAGHPNLVHFDAVTPGCHSNGNIEYWFCPDCEGFWQNEELTQLTNSKNIILPATGSENVVHFEAVEPGCHYNGNIEYWFCPDCEGFWQNKELTQLTNSKNIVLPATGGDVQHVEAAEPVCHRPGNIEYWFCSECEQFWQNEELTQLTNSKNVKIGAEKALEYHAKVEATCVENGMNEYWYCAECNCFYTDADGKYNIAYLSLTIAADGTAHKFEHHEAADPVCHRNGNVEYWYCGECDCYFIEVEGNKVNSNSKNVVILADNDLKHTAKVDATCTENGMNEYWYCDDCNCFFTDAEGKYNIAYLSLTIPAAHDYVDGKCTVCGASPSTGDAGFISAVAGLLVSAMSTVALVSKKKEF